MSSSTPIDQSDISKQSEDDKNDDTGTSTTHTATDMSKSSGTGTSADTSTTTSNDDDIDIESSSSPAAKKSRTGDSTISNTTATSSHSTDGLSSSTSSSTSGTSGASSSDGKAAVVGIVDPKANIDGTIISIDGSTDPCDCMLVQVDTASVIDNFFVLQLISCNSDGTNGNNNPNSPTFAVYKRWGSTFSTGQDDGEVYEDYAIAVQRFQTIFEDLTGYTWNNRASASVSTGGSPIPNKYELIQQNMEQKKRGYNGGKWQYKAGNPHRPRWDDYDPLASKYVEQLFYEFGCNPHLSKRLVNSDWYRYEIDFVSMTQTNVQHPDRTSREIQRCPILQNSNDQQSIYASLHSMSVSQAPSLPHRLNPTEFRTLPETLKYVASDDESNIVISKLIPTTPPTDANEADCVICLSEMKASEDIVKFDVTDCSHMFHRNCIESSIRMSKPQCPTCRRPIREVRGFSPSGTMSISTTREVCMGYESTIGTIEIDYRLPSDVQKQYHPNPGKSFYGTIRTAYLPDNKEGKELLLRLKYAWMKGLCFTVGTSMTTGRSNVITWSSIHHKTSMYAGVHGFPDPHFFWNCNFELDGLGVPKAHDVKTSPYLLEPLPYTVEQSTSSSSSASASASASQVPTRIYRSSQLSNSVAAAVASMTINGSTPSQLQLQNGLSILNIIRNKINGADVSDSYEELSSQFYSTIPHSFGRSRPPVISTFSAFQERYDACIHLMNP